MKILDLVYMICAAVVLLALAWHTEALALESEGPVGQGVTPYGDFCPRCSNYGVGRHPVSHKVALEALQEYFHAKGLTVENVHGRGRFLKADIYKGGEFVDRIVFDKKSGRIRSIY